MAQPEPSVDVCAVAHAAEGDGRGAAQQLLTLRVGGGAPLVHDVHRLLAAGDEVAHHTGGEVDAVDLRHLHLPAAQHPGGPRLG